MRCSFLVIGALAPVACGSIIEEPELGRSAVVDIALDAGSAISEGLACFAYMEAVCERYAVCRRLPQVAEGCLALGAGCRNEFLVEGSTRTAQNLVSCADQYEQFDCDLLLRGQSPECATPGTLPAGAPCAGHMACQSSFCDEDASGERTCYALAERGGECTGRTLCPPGEACVLGLCETIFELTLESGNAPQGGVGDPCYETSYCQDGLFCLFTSVDSGVCAQPPSAGESCSSDRPYAEGAPATICDQVSYCASSGVCEGLPWVDEPCAARSDGLLPVCRAGSYCDAKSEVCAPTKAVGERCLLPTAFASTSGIALAPECDTNADLVCACPSEQSCEPGNGRCLRAVRPGERCDFDAAHCSYGAACNSEGLCDYP